MRESVCVCVCGKRSHRSKTGVCACGFSCAVSEGYISSESPSGNENYKKYDVAVCVFGVPYWIRYVLIRMNRINKKINL